ncbi:hypothetical protein KAR91_41030 [Candidatus Pacearchaeota archaeon]|nr:hypothetical protein [Candidatus Pacearchaeota archaeon]
MNTTGKFYIVNESGDKIKVAFLTPLPILWNRDGQFSIIRKAIVENAIDIKKMHDKSDSKVTIPAINIMWSQGIPTSNATGRALIGE